MSRRLYGTRFTTGCGHSWRRRRPWYTVKTLSCGATSDCPVCGELLYIVPEQFDGMRPDGFPAEVHMPLFHKWMSQQDPGWSEDGRGTGYVEFSIDDNEGQT